MTEFTTPVATAPGLLLGVVVAAAVLATRSSGPRWAAVRARTATATQPPRRPVPVMPNCSGPLSLS